ncbi:hypothetical protein [Halobacillus mangrovi]|uniref:hypothetical protein n=1 Tax=Halobacillus mangrovi TaxID=402384 RepID=UPI003D96C533
MGKDYFYKTAFGIRRKKQKLRDELKVKRDKIQEYDSKLASREKVLAYFVQR